MAQKKEQQKKKGRSSCGGGPAPFLVKTHEMVEDEDTNEVISWGETGVSFVVWKPVEFARDLLPAHFKHNNFSSFVRQLNTYGFRKVVPDRWEFANENFRRGERSLLCEIRRRKAPPPQVPSAIKPGGTPSSTSNSGEIHSSSTTSSPSLPAEQQLLELSSENKKLKRDNQLLSTELAHAKKHCEELLGFLSRYVDVSQLNTTLLTQETAAKELGITGDKAKVEQGLLEVDDDKEKQESLKLFGVIVRTCEEEKTKKRKRGRCNDGDRGLPMKPIGFGSPWMGMIPPTQGSSKVRN